MNIKDLHIHDKGDADENSKKALDLLLMFLEFNSISEVLIKAHTDPNNRLGGKMLSELQARAQEINNLIEIHPMVELARQQMVVQLAIWKGEGNSRN